MIIIDVNPLFIKERWFCGFLFPNFCARPCEFSHHCDVSFLVYILKCFLNASPFFLLFGGNILFDILIFWHDILKSNLGKFWKMQLFTLMVLFWLRKLISCTSGELYICLILPNEKMDSCLSKHNLGANINSHFFNLREREGYSHCFWLVIQICTLKI